MQVSKWLGHSTFTLTLDVYGDDIPEQEMAARKHPAGTTRSGEARRATEQRGDIVRAEGELANSKQDRRPRVFAHIRPSLAIYGDATKGSVPKHPSPLANLG